MSARAYLAALTTAAVMLSVAPSALAQPGRELNCADPLFTAEINQCAEANFRVAEEEMEAVFAQAIAQFAEQDRTHAEEDPQYTGAEALLRESQSAWESSRSAFCGASTITFSGGSMRPAVEFTCLARITRHRTEELRWLLD